MPFLVSIHTLVLEPNPMVQLTTIIHPLRLVPLHQTKQYVSSINPFFFSLFL